MGVKSFRIERSQRSIHTKSFTKRGKLEEKMIEFIDLTKKLEPEAKTEDYISIQSDAMGEAIRDFLCK